MPLGTGGHPECDRRPAGDENHWRSLWASGDDAAGHQYRSVYQVPALLDLETLEWEGRIDLKELGLVQPKDAQDQSVGEMFYKDLKNVTKPFRRGIAEPDRYLLQGAYSWYTAM